MTDGCHGVPEFLDSYGEPPAKSEFATAADSFLIGHAVAGGHTVVTHEASG